MKSYKALDCFEQAKMQKENEELKLELARFKNKTAMVYLKASLLNWLDKNLKCLHSLEGIKMSNKAIDRNKFIDDWTDVVMHQSGGNLEDKLAVAYTAFAVSQIMDAAILHRKKLDEKIDEGYRL